MAAAVGWVFAHGVNAAFAQIPDGPYIEPEKRFARVVRVVPPDYPRAMLAAKRVAVVDVEGIVEPVNGVLTSPRVHSTAEGAEPFISAVSEVLQYWRFEPTFERDCQPSKDPVLVRVHFELDADDTPRVFVSHSKDPVVRQWRDHNRQEDYKTVKRVAPAYPQGMVRRGIMANVYALMVIDPAGAVTDVRAMAYPNMIVDRHRSVERQEIDLKRIEAIARVFQDAVESALKQWTFVAVDSPARRSACYDIVFRIRD
jgi:hypothetical protein